QEMLVLHGHTHWAGIKTVTFSPDGKRLVSAGYDKTMRIWDAATGQEILLLRHPDWVRGVAFSPDGKLLASAREDRTVRVWNATPSSGEILAERQAWVLVDSLFAKLLLKADVIAGLQADATLSEEVRRLALQIAQTRGEDPLLLNNTAWDVLKAA